MNREDIIVVSGLPRSGTSMMMQMLKNGGLELVTDNIRKADINNLNGYYEFDKVKRLKDDNTWLGIAKGKVVKIVLPLLKYLPDEYNYRIILMYRMTREVVVSSLTMLDNKEKCKDTSRLEHILKMQSSIVMSWLRHQTNMNVLAISYNDTLMDSKESARRINRFLNGILNVEKMVEVVDNELYRQRL